MEKVLDYVLCAECGRIPWNWDIFYEPITKAVIEYRNDGEHVGETEENNNDNLQQNSSTFMANLRELAYKIYVREKYGYWGAGNRIRIPHCILMETRRMCQDE